MFFFSSIGPSLLEKYGRSRGGKSRRLFDGWAEAKPEERGRKEERGRREGKARRGRERPVGLGAEFSESMRYMIQG